MDGWMDGWMEEGNKLPIPPFLPHSELPNKVRFRPSFSIPSFLIESGSNFPRLRQGDRRLRVGSVRGGLLRHLRVEVVQHRRQEMARLLHPSVRLYERHELLVELRRGRPAGGGILR